ncbi:MAG TPA: thermosome subunit beta [Candidatus Nanoarchaeia archaeon]|nr:thermosome subunit beta [Candidatus Nanoarchaeia archaeon]
MTQQFQPIFILPEGSMRSSGKTAQRNNIAAARAVADAVRSTLGPKGMDKMLVDTLGDITVTNDGVTILNEMKIEHPTAKMIVEVAKSMEDEVGDGTTTAVIIAGELLKKAEELLDMEIHPTVLARGYRVASEKALEILNRIAEPVEGKSAEDILSKIANTAMTGKGAEVDKEHLSQIVVAAVKQVADKDGDFFKIDNSNIKIEKKVGASVEDSELIEGILIDKERVHSAMPKTVKNAKIALVDAPLEVKDTETDAKISITSPDQIQAFLAMEEKMVRDKAEKVIASGATVLFCQKGIDDLAQHFLAKKGIYALRRVSEDDMKKLAQATSARIVNKLEDLSQGDLGFAGIVEAVKIGNEQMTAIRNCKNPKAVTILIRGGTVHVVDEVKRAIEDAIRDISVTMKTGKAVGGAGSVEIELAQQLAKFADSLSGREQLAVKAFAESLEVIPRTLAENAGLDPIDVIAELKSAHDKKLKWAGIDVFSGKVMDAWKRGVIEPLSVKTQAISSASEVASLILRIDDVISSAKVSDVPAGPPPDMGY